MLSTLLISPLTPTLAFDVTNPGVYIPAVIFGVIVVGILVALSKFFRKVGPEEALVGTGIGGMRVASGGGMWVVPIMHRVELMDLSVKRIEIARRGSSGLICKDNVRADIEVAFFVRVNNQKEAIMQVAQSLGCRRSSEHQSLVELFDAKFSEALKTVGKRFDFVELYEERDKFKEAILAVIGTDLNGYILDDCAIDYLEQTPLELLNQNNILDAEGIKKITENRLETWRARMFSCPSRSAIVRATLRIRWYARAENPNESIERRRILSPSSSIRQYFFIARGSR